ncbi:hypothetical protein CP98_04749 [Sphingobium yanoikuyae]|uniref:Uncharacterized protein n=1 Tax=Sphingobium yanoikuyae TaxID=13690 RepID=A0A084E9L1_SPHYA|nr:hypothetical protein CP98_04749 [Sphingobium yanoikuyae]
MGEADEASFKSLADRCRIGQLIGKDEIETAQDCPIQDFGQISRSDDDRRPGVLVEELEKRVQHPARFTHVIAIAPRCGESIDLVEEIDATRRFDGVEHEFQFLGGLAHELCYEAVQHHGKERKLELAGKAVGAHRLSSARRSGKQNAPPRL